MTTESTTRSAGSAEPHLLSGAYVLDAVGDDERALFEDHMTRCAACATEVAELAETAARLAAATARTPPPELRDAVLRTIATVRQDPPTVPGQGRERWAWWRRRPGRVGRLALAACLAAAALLGGTTVWQWQRAEDAQQRADAARAASDRLAGVLAAADATVGTASLPDGTAFTVVASRSEDRAAFLSPALPEPPAGQVYQLWFDQGGTMRPAGLLDDASASRQALLMEGPLAGASGMGITVEPAGGSPEPTSAPLAALAFGG